MSLYSDLNEVLTPYAQRIKDKADKSTTYTKTEVDNLISEVEVETDTTLDVPGAPADSAETGRQIGLLKADLADVTNHAVKSAEQLISDKRTTDKVPYKYRASQSGKSDRAYDMIVGGTVCFNQIVKNMRGNSTEKGLTFVNNNGTITISGTVTEAFDYNTVMLTNNTVNFKRDGSKYLLMLNKGIPFAWGVSGYGNVIPAGNRAGIWTNNSGGVWTNGLAFRVEVGHTVDIHELKASVFDLTQMFGTAIADHIYALEQATAGAGVALFRAMFADDYYPYNVGRLVSVEGLSAHVMRDEDDNIVGSYPLDSSLTLRGVPVLKDGKVEFDGDTYEADGTVTRRYGIVDLGALTWLRTTSYTNAVLYTSVPSRKVGYTISAICAKYVMSGTYTSAQGFSVSDDKTFGLGGLNAQIFVRDDSFTDPTAFKSAMSGVYLVYELATPTTEEATPYTFPQIVSPYGTEEYISESVCPVGHITEYPDNLRAKIDGLPWSLQMIAPVEVTYTATRNYTTGQLLIVDNTLYKVTANIANGGAITVGINVVSTTLSTYLDAVSFDFSTDSNGNVLLVRSDLDDLSEVSF